MANRSRSQFFPDNQLRSGNRRHQLGEARRHRPDGVGLVDLGQPRAAGRHVRPRLSLRQLPAADQGASMPAPPSPIEEALLKGAEHPHHRLGLQFRLAQRCCRRSRADAGGSGRPEDPHAAQSGDHRMPAPDGRGRDAAGVRRNLHGAAGRRARRPRARSADHRRQQVLRDREVLHADRSTTSRRSRPISARPHSRSMEPKLRDGFLDAAQKAAADTARARPGGREGSARCCWKRRASPSPDCDKEAFRKRVQAADRATS